MPAEFPPTPRRLLAGALAGLAGGVPMGLWLQVRGLMDNVIAALVGSESALIGWLVHLAVSVLFGVAFAAVMHETSLWYGLREGFAYAMILWLVTGTLVLRSSLGIPFQLDRALGILLLGHVIYGIVFGPAYAAIWGNMHSHEAPHAQPAA